jgi:hypothetical protein
VVKPPPGLANVCALSARNSTISTRRPHRDAIAAAATAVGCSSTQAGSAARADGTTNVDTTANVTNARKAKPCATPARVK